MKSLLAYISLICLNIIGIIIFLKLLGFIDLTFGETQFLLFVIGLPLSLIYHKCKPMTFSELIKKYLKISLPTWNEIKYKVQVFIGTDPEYLDKDFKEKKD